MVVCNFCIEDLSMSMEGHALQRQAGEQFDLVCCAASVVGQGLLYNIEDVETVHKVEKTVENGKLSIHVICPEYLRGRIKGLMRYARNELLMLQEAYPDAIKVLGGEAYVDDYED